MSDKLKRIISVVIALTLWNSFPAYADLSDLSSMYSYDTLEWLASLYDPEIGGFYYSVSARENESFEPDIESTSQAIDILYGSGVLTSSRPFPSGLRTKILAFFLERQSEEDGYFYDRQFGKNVTDSKKERNLGQAVDKIKKLGGTPKYLLPTQRTSVLSLMAEDKYSSEEAYILWLKSLKINTASDTYGAASQASTTYSIAEARDYGNAAREYLKSIQNKTTGLWGQGLAYNNTNAAMKLSYFFTGATEQYPLFDSMLNSVKTVISEESSPYSIVDLWNPFVLVSNARKSCKSLSDVQKQNIEALIEYASSGTSGIAKDLKKFKREDNGYSYYPSKSTERSSGSLVSLGLAEGDVNGTTMATQGMVNKMNQCLGLSNATFWKDYYTDFISLLENAEPITKKPYNFVCCNENFEAYTDFLSGDCWSYSGTDSYKIASLEKNGTTTKALGLGTVSGTSTEATRRINFARMNSTVISFDFMVDENSTYPHYYFSLGNTALCLTIMPESGQTYKICERTSGSGNGADIASGLEKGDWHNLEIMYYPEGIGSTYVRFCLDGSFIKETGDYYINSSLNGLPLTYLDRIKFSSFLDGDGMVYIDNLYVSSENRAMEVFGVRLEENAGKATASVDLKFNSARGCMMITASYTDEMTLRDVDICNIAYTGGTVTVRGGSIDKGSSEMRIFFLESPPSSGRSIAKCFVFD